MTRTFLKLTGLLFLIVAGGFGIHTYLDHTELNRQLDREREKNQILKTTITRLGAEKRVAEIVVADRTEVNGVPRSTLLFFEQPKNPERQPIAKRVVVDGKMIHFECKVIKFERGFIEDNDELRGHSIVLFTRVYGDVTAPNEGVVIDNPGHIPEIYQSSDPRASLYEQELWQSFWKLATDEAYAKSKGVKVAQGEELWGPFEEGKIYTINIESTGGLNLSHRPIEPIYKAMMKVKTAE